MQIVKGCDGTKGLLLIVAVMFAFPAILRDKVIGLVMGIFSFIP